MTRNVRQALEADLAPALWRDLEPHARRNALFVVAPGRIVDVGDAVSCNRTADVERVLAAGELARPGADQLTAWGNRPGKVFQCLIVQPFVLIEELDVPDVADVGARDVTLEELVQFVRTRSRGR